MKKLNVEGISVALILGCTLFAACDTKAAKFDVAGFLDKTYITIGAGYKVQEPTLYYWQETNYGYEKVAINDPFSARLEIGYHYSKNVKFGISHHSQWLTGAPINNGRETFKTEIFVDYTFTLGDVFND